MKRILDGMQKTMMAVKPPRYTALEGLQKAETANPFKILIGTVLSARTKDENTTKAVTGLFKVYNTPQKLAKAKVKDVEKIIKSVGFYHVKARRIIEVANIILTKYRGKVPPDMDKLVEIPGVGRKTANCVLVYAFEKPAIPVDTHVHRLGQRWGLTNGKNVIQTEQDLKRFFPKKYWNKLHLQIIYYGREYCKARECYGLTCKICTTCYPNRRKSIKTKKA